MNESIEGKANMLVRVLKLRLGAETVSEDLVKRIKACSDSDQLDRWIYLAAAAPALDEFRRAAGL